MMEGARRGARVNDASRRSVPDVASLMSALVHRKGRMKRREG
jgi:hypothetical protein